MKKILKLFVGSLLIIGLVIIGVGCKKERNLEYATMTSDQIGVYYNLNEETLEVQSGSLVVKEANFAIFTDGKEFIVKDEKENELKLSFDGKNVTLDGYGTYTKRDLAKVAEEKQGVYAEALTPTSTVIVREGSVTLSDKSVHTLFTDETGIYFLANNKVNYVAFTSVTALSAISIEGTTYIITGAPIPAEEGEFTKLVRKVIEKLTSQETRDIALEASGSLTAKQEIVEGEKDPNKFDLIGAFLGDTAVSATANVNIKNFKITDLSNLLAEIKLHLTAAIQGENQEVNVQVNVQDGKVLVKQDKGNPERAEYSIEDLPTPDEIAEEILEEEFDYEGLLAKLAEIEAKLASIGVKYSNIKVILDNIFALTENELKINITKEKLQTALLSAQLLIATNLDKLLETAWGEMSESAKAEYQSYDAFKKKYSDEISNAFIEAQTVLSDITINECKIEINFNTFATVVKVDIVLPGEDKVENEAGEEQVVCKYNTTIKANVQITPVESKAIEKVNPEDYILTYAKVQAGIKEYLPTLVFPELSDKAEFQKRISEYDDSLYNSFELTNLTEAEANAVIAAFFDLAGEEVGTYFSHTIINEETVLNVSAYKGENKDETGAVVSYYVSVAINVSESHYFKFTPTLGEGITIKSTYFDGTSACVEDEFNGSVSFEDSEKVVYVLVNGKVYDIVHNGDYFNIFVTANTRLEFQLGEYDSDYVSLGWYGYPYTLEGPAYGKAGETLTYVIRLLGSDDGAKVNVKLDGEVIAENLSVGESFTYTVPAEAYYISFTIEDANAVSE